MSIQVNVDCEHCGATYEITHHMDPQRYIPEGCAFCGSQDISTDREDDNNEDEHRVA